MSYNLTTLVPKRTCITLGKLGKNVHFPKTFIKTNIEIPKIHVTYDLDGISNSYFNV